MKGFLTPTLAKYRQLSGDSRFDDLLNKEADGYTHFQLSGSEQRLMDDLQSFNQALGSNWPIFTEEMRYTDRVLAFDGNYLRFYLREPPPALNSSIYSMITGNVGNAIHFPLNAVR